MSAPAEQRLVAAFSSMDQEDRRFILELAEKIVKSDVAKRPRPTLCLVPSKKSTLHQYEGRA